MTTESVRRNIEDLLTRLVEANLVLIPNQVIAQDSRVTWAAPPRRSPLVDFGRRTTIAHYEEWAVSGDFTAMMFDGALIQMSYTFQRNKLVKHRLLYLPCPYAFSEEDLQNYPVEMLLEDAYKTPHAALGMQSPVRFDYAPSDSGTYHPSSHLTLNVSCCRIPISKPLAPMEFIGFVFQHFYFEWWIANPHLFKIENPADTVIPILAVSYDSEGSFARELV